MDYIGGYANKIKTLEYIPNYVVNLDIFIEGNLNLEPNFESDLDDILSKNKERIMSELRSKWNEF